MIKLIVVTVREFQEINMAFGDGLDHKDWIDIYKKLVYWDLEIHNTENKRHG